MKFDMFEEYVTAAEKEGWVDDSDFDGVKTASDDIDRIEMLYGVKPNDSEDDEDITDKAHPETVVISPAHDKMNGVAENDKERQNIMNYVATKMPGGHQTHHRYVAAYDDLNKALIRTAFTLDHKNEAELMNLADSCAQRLEKEAIAPAIFGAVAWWVYPAAVSAALGIMALINRTDDSRQNIIANSESVLKELADLKEENYPAADRMIEKISTLQQSARSFKPIKANLTNAPAVVSAAEKYSSEIAEAKKYISSLVGVQKAIPEFKQTLQRVEVDEEDSYDIFQKIEDVGRFVLSIPTDAEDVINALGGLEKAIGFAIKEVQYIINLANKAQPVLEKQLKESDLMASLEPNSEPVHVSNLPEEKSQKQESPISGVITDKVEKAIA